MTAADLLSLARIPLAALFLFVADRPPVALAVLLAAGITDVLDGWVARRSTPPVLGVPHRGDWLDPLCDKVFALAVVIGLIIARPPPLSWLLMLMAREQLQLIAVVLMRVVPVLRRATHNYDFRAHAAGKATTVAQFAAGAALLWLHPLALWLCAIAGALGSVSVAIYVWRVRAALAGASRPSAATAP